MTMVAGVGGGSKPKKNIMVCCDGTNNRFLDRVYPEDSNTNVVKFYTALAIDNEQVGYYHPGVGTGTDPQARNRLENFVLRMRGLAFAKGFRDNVLDAYRYLMDTYADGDRVFLVGFSRGAYTVRALAGLLDGYGLLCPGNQGHLPYAWTAYVSQHKDREQGVVVPNEAFKMTFSRPRFVVHFLGIWDTVSSVGWVNTPLRLWNVARAPGIEVGRHAISLDERRCFYRDNLFDEPQLAIKAVRRMAMLPRTATEAKQDLLQVWFPGVHSDVGGSYSQRESVLANAALQWMLEEARKAGAVLKPEMQKMVLGEPVEGTDEVERKKIAELRELYAKPEKWVVHRSLRSWWWLLEALPHRYYDKDEGEEVWRTPLGMHRRIPGGSYIHHTAVDLISHGNGRYRPKNLLDPETSLQPVEVAGQPAGTLFEYRPARDPQPLLNQPAVRWTVMIAVSVGELALLGVLVWLLSWGAFNAWRLLHG